ncbi:hypothetical protein QFC22_005125 [Naganishia vaughanmartiniae]|uniref:Uncharacterized protein n=1 Tax=Naganishia vaughanmartiniae TaxID=1424756 RepID=A0ACC2WZN6_9TREE|nr:hypothetical protein QFC22_005125 [Naganishia vaughanmartiniae]
MLKRTLAVQNPTGVQILQWISHIAGYRVLKMSASKQHDTSRHTEGGKERRLVRLSLRDWGILHTAAHFSNCLACFLPLDETVPVIEEVIGGPMDAAVGLDTGISFIGQKAVFFRYEATKLVLAFEATKANEMIFNAWSHAKDDKWYALPYARFLDGRQGHSFYLDMWLGMRSATLEALTDNILKLEGQGKAPSSFIVSGHSMGGGIST